VYELYDSEVAASGGRCDSDAEVFGGWRNCMLLSVYELYDSEVAASGGRRDSDAEVFGG
jgi:hypothetical protein